MRDILYNEYRCLGTFNNLQERSPHLLSWVARPPLIQQAKPLTRRSTDYNISNRNMDCGIFKDSADVPDDAVVPEIVVICSGGIRVKIVCPHRMKRLIKGFRET